ncbi:hypothetical protein HYV88_01270 [Candidatus Woesearchaeota archaeon]|nr:hypothetical protein [Candidatus Woesearchaeota archaeon]
MTTIEIFAFIIATLALIKIIVLSKNPGTWIKLVKKIYSNPQLMTIISLILSLIVLYYLLLEITIVQIFAVMLFIALLGTVSISAYSKEMVSLVEKLSKDKDIMRKLWPAILIWIILILWVFYVLLF